MCAEQGYRAVPEVTHLPQATDTKDLTAWTCPQVDSTRAREGDAWPGWEGCLQEHR
jgi:hypothetical protein